MNPMRDYLGVWPDVGTPPDIPFPATCPRTGRVLCVSHVRYLEYADGRWQIPDAPQVTPAAEGTPSPAVTWALHLPPHAPRSSKVLAARVLNGEYPPELDAILKDAATGGYLGTVGERRDGRARIVSVTRQPDHAEYGPQYRVNLEIDGEACVWWTGEGCWCDEGDDCDVRFTVKAHTVYHGRRVTTVTRVSKKDAEKRK